MENVKIMKKTLIIIILSSIIFLFGSCNDAIFYKVHEEIPLLKPLIDGSPSNFVILDDAMYVASGKKIFKYISFSDKKMWIEWARFDNFVISLASTNNYLYALYLNNNTGKISRFDKNGNRTDLFLLNNIGLLYNIQSIYSNEDILFFSAREENKSLLDFGKYKIYYVDENASLSDCNEILGTTFPYILKGLAYDSDYYYLCTYLSISYIKKDELDSATALPVPPPPGFAPANFTGFTGIINLNDDPSSDIFTAAITNNGYLYQINNAESVFAAKFSDDRFSTGALAVWKNSNIDPTISLLLVGRAEYKYTTSTGYSNGYIEIALNPATGTIAEGAIFFEPGRVPAFSSIDSFDRYVSSLGKKPINHIIQTPYTVDPNMTLFASTQKDGVWSYRMRNGNWQWNAEQNN